MPDLMQSPSEILAERVSDADLSAKKQAAQTAASWDFVQANQRAFNRAGIIAIRAVKSAAAAGNVQCKRAEKQIDAFLSTMQPKPE